MTLDKFLIENNFKLPESIVLPEDFIVETNQLRFGVRHLPSDNRAAFATELTLVVWTDTGYYTLGQLKVN